MVNWLRPILPVLLAIALVSTLTGPAASADTLGAIRARGHLLCGVGEGPAGFSQVDERGAWSGLDIDFCAGLAAAIFGRKDAVKFRPLPVAQQFTALVKGDVDLLARSATWTLSRDNDLGARFVGAHFHDGLGLLVRRTQGVSSVLELSGATVCVSTGGAGHQQLEEFFSLRGMRLTAIPFDKWEEAVQAYVNRRCIALSADTAALALVRAGTGNPGEHLILPEILSKEPLGPVVRKGDETWFSIVRWVQFALVTAEEFGVLAGNVDAARSSSIAEVRRLLGTDGDLGASLGLGRDWAYHLIKAVGNYGEMFERNVGMRSPLRLERGLNNLWSKGGLMFAPPFR